MELDLVIGSGGVLSHAPHRLGAALMMLDGFGLSGVTELTVDSIFMMPHLGVFASVHPEAAEEIFVNDCLVHIAHSVVPVFSNTVKPGTELARVRFDGKELGVVRAGEVSLYVDCAGSSGELLVEPLSQKINIGSGNGKPWQREITLGEFGIIFDGRNRPVQMAESPQERAAIQNKIYDELGLLGEVVA